MATDDLQPLFEDGPEDFIATRLRAYVAHVNGIDPEAPPAPEPQPEASGAESESDDEDEADDPEFQGEDAWKADAIRRVRGLWTGDSSDYASVWGVEPPQALRDFEKAVAGANPWSTFNEFRLDCAQMAAPSDDETNLFEQLILNDQLNYLGTALPEAFAGVAGIGSLGNGDTYHLSVPGLSEEDGSKVIFFDHEEHCFSDEFADSLDSLAYLCALTYAHNDEKLSDEAAAAGYAALRTRVSPSWHFSIDERDEDFEAYETDDRIHRYCFWRARWLITMFRHDHGGDPADVGQAFIADFNPVVDEAMAKARSEIAQKVASTAIYAAWRAYIFEEPELDLYLDACRNHKSRIARDAGRLIEELQAGRKVLGRILDWPAKLAAVRALDLDPRRAEAREEEARARKAALDARREALTTAMAALEGEALEVFCREHAPDASVRTSLMAALLERPALTEAKRAATFLAEDGYSRNGCLYRDEEHDACRHLADHANDALQMLLVGELIAPSEHESSDDEDAPKPFPAFSFAQIEQMMIRWQHEDALRAESLALVRGALADDDSGKRWRVTAFSKILARSDDASAGDVLADRVRAIPAEGGFETRMHHDDSGRDLATALGKVGAPEHAEALVALAKSETMNHAAPAAALALARLDATKADDVILERLLDRTTRVNDHEDASRALLAYGLIGRAQPGETHARLLASLEACDSMASRYPDTKTGRAFATMVLSPEEGRDAARAAAVEALRETITYAGYKPITSHRFVLEFLRDCPELAADVGDVLPALLGSEDAVFRGEVARALAKLGVEHPPSAEPFQWLEVERMSVDEALAALADTSRTGRQHVARRLGSENTAAVREALEAAMGDVIDRAPEDPGADLPRSLDRLLGEIVHAMNAQGHVPVELFDRALRHPNRDVKDPILRNPPAEPKLADAMRVVANEKWGWQESTANEWLSENGQ